MNNAEIKIVPATPELLKQFYGDTPLPTMRAIVGVRGNEALGLGGYFVHDARAVVFSEIKPEGLKYKKAIMKGTKQVLGMVRKAGLPAHAISESARYMDHFGFVKDNSGVYICQTP